MSEHMKAAVAVALTEYNAEGGTMEAALRAALPHLVEHVLYNTMGADHWEREDNVWHYRDTDLRRATARIAEGA